MACVSEAPETPSLPLRWRASLDYSEITVKYHPQTYSKDNKGPLGCVGNGIH